MNRALGYNLTITIIRNPQNSIGSYTGPYRNCLIEGLGGLWEQLARLQRDAKVGSVHLGHKPVKWLGLGMRV